MTINTLSLLNLFTEPQKEFLVIDGFSTTNLRRANSNASVIEEKVCITFIE